MQAHIEAGRADEAAALLCIARSNPSTRVEAYIWEGLRLIDDDPHAAYRLFSAAATAKPDEAQLHLLQAHAADKTGEPELAHQLVENALYVDPLSPKMRIAAWRSRAKNWPQDKLHRELRKWLPDATDPTELAVMLSLLPRGPVGVVQYDQATSELRGWAIDTSAPASVIAVECRTAGKAMKAPAAGASPILRAAKVSGHGAFRIKVPAGNYKFEVCLPDGNQLCGSPLVPLPPLTLPPPPKGDPRKQPIDILIPVYRGQEETLACIHSVLNAQRLNGTKHEIIVLEDASPEPALVEALIALAKAGRITMVRHPANLGFIRGMNRGMVMHPERDVIWLNADTLVHGNWVDRLRQAAYSAPDIASVTPFSNNAELMSFPEPSRSHPMPDVAQLKHLDTLAAATKTAPVPLDVGNGFCMYLRRKAMAAIGFLDEVHMARGYGEETDWCLRATAAGFRHVGAPNVFVAHKGEVSFGAEKRTRVMQNLRIIDQRYPWAEQAYVRFTLADPVEPARQRLQAARFAELPQALASGDLEAAIYLEDRLSDSSASSTSMPPDGRLRLIREYRFGKWWVVLKAAIQPLEIQRRYAMPSQMQLLRDDLARLALLRAETPIYGTVTPAIRPVLTELGLPTTATATQAVNAPVASTALTAGAWFIGDAVDSDAARNWIAIARDSAASQAPAHLMLCSDVPLQATLRNTGIVLRSDVPRRASAPAHARACKGLGVLQRASTPTALQPTALATHFALSISTPLSMSAVDPHVAHADHYSTNHD